MNDQHSDHLPVSSEPRTEADLPLVESEFRDPYSSQNRRADEIIETRGEDLGGEQTGLKDSVVTSLSNVSEGTADERSVVRRRRPSGLRVMPRQGRSNAPGGGLGTLPQQQAEARRGLSAEQREAQKATNLRGAALARAALHGVNKES